jgi:hypothetical protein
MDLSERKDSSHYGLYPLWVSAHDEQAFPLRFEQQDANKVLLLHSASKSRDILIREEYSFLWDAIEKCFMTGYIRPQDYALRQDPLRRPIS